MKSRPLRNLLHALLLGVACVSLYKAYKMMHDQHEAVQSLPRNEKLRLFNPHQPQFTCEIEATKVPPIDAQADAWFLEARALEDPNTWEEDRDYKKIVKLTRDAAERRHWKAMLNLASLYLEQRDPPHGENDALALVEEAMRLGIPAAYDRMGTYYMQGVGMQGDSTNAFAFWQKAAQMGNPQAMAYLGDKMSATWDSPRDGFWANIPIATKMLECALSQGYGPAAYTLAALRELPLKADGTLIPGRTAVTKEHALRTLHDGVKFGCSECARDLWAEFDHPDDLADMLVPHLDKARSERYGVLNRALQFNPTLRFPNLDKVLPLPPAPLPPWNGDKHTLIDAAKGVAPPPAVPKPTTASQRTGRHHLEAAYDFRRGAETTSLSAAPFGGYWQPAGPAEAANVQAYLANIPPGLYHRGEPFERIRYPAETGQRAIAGLVWEHVLTVHRDRNEQMPKAAAGVTREAARPEPRLQCDPHMPCPVTGTWQPWLPPDHPLEHAINHAWRQTWLMAGRPFPDPRREWPFPLDGSDLKWHLMDSPPPGLA